MSHMKSVCFHRFNLEKHGVSIYEAEEALKVGWKSRRRVGDNYEVLGRTAEGRYLQLLIEETSDLIRIFHGRDMNATERRRYERK